MAKTNPRRSDLTTTGSVFGTILWCDGEGYSTAGANQQTFLRELNVACEEIDWTFLRDSGDGVGMFFAENPLVAINAAQCLIQSTACSGIKLRFGVHFGSVNTGETDPLHNDKPFGDDMNLGARVMSAGMGGHILMSAQYVHEATAVDPRLSENLYDMGKIQVKSQHVHVFNFWNGIIGRPDVPNVSRPLF